MDLGEGIADGTNNFFKMRIYKQQKKEKDKLDSIEPIVSAIKAQLANKALPLDEKRKLIDKMELVYKAAGIKVKIPQGQTLSELIMPQELLDQYVDTGESRSETAINAVPEGTPQTEANITTSQVEMPITRRRGEMSDADIEIGLTRKAQRGLSQDETAQKKKFALFQFGLQEKLQREGYIKNPEEVVEPTSGRTWSVYTNSNPTSPPIFKPLGAYKSDRGELLLQPEENTIPVSTYTARERAKGAGGKPATLRALIFSASKELGLPEDDPAVESLAASRFSTQYQARTNNLQLGTTKGEQAVGGTEPIQPVEQERINFQRRQYTSELQGKVASADATIATEDEEITSTQAQINEAKAEIERLVKTEGYVKEDKEVREVQKTLDGYIRQLNAAKRRKAVAEGIKTRAEKEMKSFESSPSSVSSTSGEFGDKESPKIRQAITTLNANRRRLKLPELDDEASKALLRSKGFLK